MRWPVKILCTSIAVSVLLVSSAGCGSGNSGLDGGLDGGEDECPVGLMPGGCGLKGKCVECIVDADCNGGMCWYEGSCMAPSVCMTDLDCGSNSDLKCLDGLCTEPCSDDTECAETSRCNGRYCYQEWCQADGNCPDGWAPVEGSLRCSYQG